MKSNRPKMGMLMAIAAAIGSYIPGFHLEYNNRSIGREASVHADPVMRSSGKKGSYHHRRSQPKRRLRARQMGLHKGRASTRLRHC